LIVFSLFSQIIDHLLLIRRTRRNLFSLHVVNRPKQQTEESGQGDEISGVFHGVCIGWFRVILVCLGGSVTLTVSKLRRKQRTWVIRTVVWRLNFLEQINSIKMLRQKQDTFTL
jgi:hypothetical protein